MALSCMCAYLGQYWTLAWRRRGTRCGGHVSRPSHAIGLYWGIFPHTCVYRERVRKKEWETSSTLPNLTLTIILQALSWWPQESKQFVSNLRININTPQKGSNLQWVAIMTLCVPSEKVVSCVSFVLALSCSVYSSICTCMYIFFVYMRVCEYSIEIPKNVGGCIPIYRKHSPILAESSRHINKYVM